MSADREAEGRRREAVEAARYLRRDLPVFARDERFALAVGRALALYWDGYYTVENAEEMSENEALRFFDWFVFDYQHEEEERLLDIYRRERWEDLSTAQQAVLEQWSDAAPASAYTLTDYAGQTLYLEDYLTGLKASVYEPAGRSEAEVGDLILARLLPVDDHLELSGGAAFLPQDEIADLPQKLDAAREAYLEDNPQASASDFLRRYNHLFIHHALAQAEAKGRAPVARLRE